MGTVDGDPNALSAKAEAYLKGQGRREKLFSLNPRNAVFVAVDMQNFVCSPEPERALPGIMEVVAQINLMADFCHAQAIPVIWLRQCFTQKLCGDDVGLYGLFHKQPLDTGMFGYGEASEIHPEMHLDPDRDFVVAKNRYSAFAPGSSRLESLLSNLGRDQLILSGAATNVCVESTARDAMQRGYQVTVLEDATTAFDKLVHQISLLNIKLFFGDTRSLRNVIRELSDSL